MNAAGASTPVRRGLGNGDDLHAAILRFAFL
jgi:hypothetical protein